MSWQSYVGSCALGTVQHAFYSLLCGCVVLLHLALMGGVPDPLAGPKATLSANLGSKPFVTKATPLAKMRWRAVSAWG